MHRYLKVSVCLVVIFFYASQAFAADPSGDDVWSAGSGKAKITPPVPMPMAGYASRGAKHADGMQTELWAKTLILKDAKRQQAVLITLDLVGIDRLLSDRICERLETDFQIPRRHISLATSHTHSGPVVAGNLRPMHYALFDQNERQLVDQYATFLIDQIAHSVQTAVENIKPADIAWGSGYCSFGTNRRNNPADEVPQLRATGRLKGPVDHDVPVLSIRHSGELACVVFGYACHCTTLSDFQWSGDYAAYAQKDLEQAFPGCVAMFWAGCGADQNPLPRRQVSLAEKYGTELAYAVKQVLGSPMPVIQPELHVQFEWENIAFGPLPTREELVADSRSTSIYTSSRAESLLKTLDEKGSLSGTYAYPIATWKLGNQVTWVFLGGEVVVDYSLRLKHELSADSHLPTSIWIAAYSNDVMAYIPSRRVLAEGGYEGGGAMVYYGLPTVWASEIEESIVEAVHLQYDDNSSANAK